MKDTVFDAPAGQITGFTLSGRGLWAGPLKQSLPMSGVHALGRDAVVIPSGEVLVERAAVVAPAEAEVGHVLGAKVVTDTGREVGTVLDVVVESGAGGRVIGFQVASHETAGRGKRKVYIPRGQTLAVSGHALVVPADASHFIAEGLASFTAQVEIFERRQADALSSNPSTGQATEGPA